MKIIATVTIMQEINVFNIGNDNRKIAIILVLLLYTKFTHLAVLHIANLTLLPRDIDLVLI